MHHHRLYTSNPLAILLLTCLCILTSSACKKKQDTTQPDISLRAVPVSKETRNEEGLIVRTYDDNNDGLSEITKYFEEYTDPTDPTNTLRRIKRMEIDVNSDGKLNVIRHYNLQGKLESEHIDRDLDGVTDTVSYYDRGKLVRKEIMKPGTTNIDQVRYYSGGKLLRVEKDTTNDGLIDYWEFYEQGNLDRIGRDFNADGRADAWQGR